MSIIVEFTVRSPDLVLHDAMAAAPDVSLNVESVDGVPPEDIVTVVLATGDDLDAFDDAIRADPTVTQIQLLDAFPAANLYRYRVSDEMDIHLYTRWIELGAAQINVEASGGDWFMQVRFPDRGTLRDFQDYCDANGVEFQLQRIYNERTPSERAGLTDAQQEALELALENGYFEVPRETDLASVAAELGVSEQSVSERLRRAMRNLARQAADRQS